MLRRTVVTLAILATIPAGSPTAGASGELSLVAGYETGDYGTDVDTDTQSFTLRYVTGDAIGFRVELPLLRVRPSAALLRTGMGPSPLGRYGHGGSTGGNGNGGGSGNGSQGDGTGGSGNGAGDGPDPMDGSDWESGVGDLQMAAVRKLVGGGARLFRVDAAARVKVPTADDDEGLGTGEWDFRAGLTGEYRFWSVTAFGGAGWNRLGDPSWIELNDVVDAYFGVEGDAFGERVTLSGWIDGHQEIVDGAGDSTVIGLELRTIGRSRWRVALTAGVGSADRDFGIMLGRAFSTGSASSDYRGMLR